jgi:AP endonuclease-1
MCEDSGSKVNHKRNLSNGTSELSPPRRSKRQKSTTNLKELSSPEASELEPEEFTPALKGEVDDKRLVHTAKEKKKKAPVKKSNEDVKPKKARKSKKDQEVESMPLALRTKGLRMFVGAHVSGAKGQCSRHVIDSIR